MSDFMDEHRNCDLEKQELSDQLDAKILENIALENQVEELQKRVASFEATMWFKNHADALSSLEVWKVRARNASHDCGSACQKLVVAWDRISELEKQNEEWRGHYAELLKTCAVIKVRGEKRVAELEAALEAIRGHCRFIYKPAYILREQQRLIREVVAGAMVSPCEVSDGD